MVQAALAISALFAAKQSNEAVTVGIELRQLAGFCLAAVMLSAIGTPANGQRAGLAMLDQLEAGRWEVRSREPGVAPDRICLSSGRRLIQLRHPDAPCERFTVEDSPTVVTVQYTCRGRGYGRTTVRRESGRLVQIQSQGIAEGLPFDFTAEARRTGDCAP